MFLQHMLAVLKPDGVVATVMPHGVLFRGGAEGEIREKIIKDDLLDTVIGLGSNLFYGTGIPAAILILRAKDSKPPERRGKVLFINADRDYRVGRAQNHLRPRDEEKITAAYREFADLEGFAKVVTLKKLAANDFNCNIRRYADNSPPPEPQDVLAHLHGGVPTAEVVAAEHLVVEAGLDCDALFHDRRDGYSDWVYNIEDPEGRELSRSVVTLGVAERAAANPWPDWWAETVELMLLELPIRRSLVGFRDQLVEAFTPHMVSYGMERFDAAGIIATWWEESVYELQTAASRGYKAVIEAWLTTAIASQNDKYAPDLHDQIAVKLLAASQLAERADLADVRARLDAEIKSAEVGSDDEEDFDDEKLSPTKIKELKSKLKEVKKKLGDIDGSLLATARENLDKMNPEEAPAKALSVLNDRLEALVADHYADMERRSLAWYENLVAKYAETVTDLQAERDNAAACLQNHLERLGYE